MEIKLLQGDCLELMQTIPDGSIDMILADPPYGTTRNKWDCVIPLDEMWRQFRRITKKNAAICIFSQMPFTVEVVNSNRKEFRYEWIWEKAIATGQLNCNFAPMKAHENILVFSKSAAAFVRDKEKAMYYFPQMSKGKPYTRTGGHASACYDAKNMRATTTENKGTRYPRDVLKFPKDRDNIHTTQKPVPLLEYLIKTYTPQGGGGTGPLYGRWKYGSCLREYRP